jgi:hypothetical protein
MSLQGDCPRPFFQETQFPATGGCMSDSASQLACLVTATLLTCVVLSGRLCLPTPTLAGNVSCCLPCPSTDWIYSDGVPLSSLRILTSEFLMLCRVRTTYRDSKLGQCCCPRNNMLATALLHRVTRQVDAPALPQHLPRDRCRLH